MAGRRQGSHVVARVGAVLRAVGRGRTRRRVDHRARQARRTGPSDRPSAADVAGRRSTWSPATRRPDAGRSGPSCTCSGWVPPTGTTSPIRRATSSPGWPARPVRVRSSPPGAATRRSACSARRAAFPLRSHVLHVGIRFPLGVARRVWPSSATCPTATSTTTSPASNPESAWGAGHSEAAIRARISRHAAHRLRGQPRTDRRGQLGHRRRGVRPERPARLGAEPHRCRDALQAGASPRVGDAAAGAGTPAVRAASGLSACRVAGQR